MIIIMMVKMNVEILLYKIKLELFFKDGGEYIQTTAKSILRRSNFYS